MITNKEISPAMGAFPEKMGVVSTMTPFNIPKAGDFIMGRFIDLTGQRFGELVVLKLLPERKNSQAYWECQCDCGDIAHVRGYELRRGRTVSCGCYSKKRARRDQMLDLNGKKFGRLTALKFHEIKNHRAIWECECECGHHMFVAASALTTGNTSSCGCSRRMDGFDAAYNSLMGRYIRSAKERDIAWDIDRDLFVETIEQPCHYCGGAPSNKYRLGEGVVYEYNGIDRKDNNKGYHPWNIVPCCKNCNVAKGKRGYQEYLAWIITSYQHLINK